MYFGHLFGWFQYLNSIIIDFIPLLMIFGGMFVKRCNQYCLKHARKVIAFAKKMYIYVPVIKASWSFLFKYRNFLTHGLFLLAVIRIRSGSLAHTHCILSGYIYSINGFKGFVSMSLDHLEQLCDKIS
jgi:hypothetical protein